MPTEQELIDAVVLDEEVPYFIREENQEIRALFRTARTRRGVRRDEAFDKLQKLIEEKLHSQYISYQGIIGHLKIKASKAWIAEDCSKQVVTLTKSVDKLLLQVSRWKQTYERLVERESELIRENIDLKNKVAALEKHVPPSTAQADCKAGGREC